MTLVTTSHKVYVTILFGSKSVKYRLYTFHIVINSINYFYGGKATIIISVFTKCANYTFLAGEFM